MLKILIADDHGVIALGAGMMISEIYPDCETDMSISVESTLKMINAVSYDMLVLDINIPGGNHVGMLHEIFAIRPGLKVLMFSSYPEETYAISYIKAGARGFVPKTCTVKEFQSAFQTILADGIYMSPFLTEHLLENIDPENQIMSLSSQISRLSTREAEVMEHIIAGKSTSEIAHKLSLALPTVSVYKNRIFEKMKVSNLSQLLKKVWELNNASGQNR
ncbi:response regulator transcription factor [Dyadobacter sp. CY345]|uniref:LuxR C-terminal-related transcriptional regulator n=1 Tax=Dyadobacter sp. CY345 TaxID=2909335 RepID=UPI001F2B2FC6|nr:response regulator transcription factor [Dyadobacter sp. CY345]MCF2447286.1 response regulator transcription factor [Dyadobacter sp. CY345]